MQIRLYANLRALAGQSTLDIREPGISNLRLLIERLIKLYPEIRPHLLDERDDLRRDLPVFVNGRNPRLSSAGMDLPLGSDDLISLFSPIASGRLNVESLRDTIGGGTR